MQKCKVDDSEYGEHDGGNSEGERAKHGASDEQIVVDEGEQPSR